MSCVGVVMEGRGRETVMIRERGNLENQGTASGTEYDKNIKQGILKQFLKAYKCLTYT